MSVYGYVRVSSESQVRDGQGLSIQRNKIMAHALARGLVVDQVFTDPAESGATPLGDRPAGRTLLSVLAPGDSVIVASLDRAWRSVGDAEATLTTWRNQEVTPHIINFPVDLSSPMGRLVFQILSAVAEFERTLIAERIRGGVRAALVSRGGQWGPSAPFGFSKPKRPGDRWVPHPQEQEVIRLARGWRAEGLTLLQTCRELNDAGYCTRHDQPWTVAALKRCVFYPHRPKSPQ